MKALVIGSGGREHALAWKLAQSERVHKVLVSPGNGGTEQTQTGIENRPGSNPTDWLQLAQAEQIDLTVVGPEVALAAGVVDAFHAAGLRIVGPSKAAAQLESSKAFSKAFMVRHGIPTAGHAAFTDAEAARAHVQISGAPIVVKADGLAAGKGVVVAQSLAEALEAVDTMLAVPGGRVVIEEFLDGEEASFIVLSDGEHVLPLATSQDHKRVGDGDTGPNTGGMGAYSPAPVITPELHAKTMREVVWPAIKGMQAEGMPFKGFLYAGLMVRPDGRIQVVEFNARLGDPEAQVLLMRLKTDLFELLWACSEGKLGDAEAVWDRRTALGVVVAAEGYPAAPKLGDALTSLPSNADDLVVFHAGTLKAETGLVSSGGRVLCVTALGDSARMAQHRAYEALAQVNMRGMQFRHDIGHRAIKR